MESSRYKVGDKVKAVPKDTSKQYYSPATGKIKMSYTGNMLRMANSGEIWTIRRVEPCSHGYIYRLDDDFWAWTDEFLEPAVKPSNNIQAKKLLSMEE